MKKILTYITIIICLIISQPTVASETTELCNHLIVAFNWSPEPTSRSNKWMFLDDTKNAVKRLATYSIENGRGEMQPVLTESDYFSCVAFRANIDQNSLEHFIRPIHSGRDSLVWIKNNSLAFQHSLNKEWNSWMTCKPYEKDTVAFSLLTAAKPYCLKYFSMCDKKAMVSRTFMIIVSDGIFNGDLYNEILNLEQFSKRPNGFEEVFSTCYDFNTSYFIRHIKTEEIKHPEKPHINPLGYVELYEFVPLQKNFSLNSVFEMPHILKLKRVRGGAYQGELGLTNRQNNSYKPLTLSVRLNEDNCLNLCAEELSDRMSIPINIGSDNKIDAIEIEGEVLLTDGIYNSTLITAHPDATLESGRDGAIVRVPVEYEEDAKILGIIPLYDFLWWGFLPDDQNEAALVWEAIIITLLVVAVIVILIIFIKKSLYYTPKIEELEINIPSNLKK